MPLRSKIKDIMGYFKKFVKCDFGFESLSFGAPPWGWGSDCKRELDLVIDTAQMK